MNAARWVKVAGVLGFLGVALGAFGAHRLKESLLALNSLAIWETAVEYHLIHAVALLAVALSKWASSWIGACWLVGVVLFSGSLYVYALTSLKWLVFLTPLGGLFFLVGWGILVFGASPFSRNASTGNRE